MLILSNQDFNNAAKVVNLPNPTAAQDAATKAYVDQAIDGLSPKDSARVRTTANVNIASPGATLDGIAMAVNDRVLLDGQTTNTQNGIYLFNGAAVAMTRTTDADTFAELEGAILAIEEGTSAGTTYRQTAVNGVLGTNAISWVTFGGGSGPASEATAGVAEIATQAETDAGTDDLRIVTPLKLKTSPFARKAFAQLIGDGTATSYAVTHNLNSLDVDVQVYRVSDGATVITDALRTNANTVTITTAAAPASNSLKVVVQA